MLNNSSVTSNLPEAGLASGSYSEEMSTSSDAVAVAAFIRAAGYTEERLKQLDLTKTPWRESPMRVLLPYKLAGEPVLKMLVRLFFFGESVSAAGAVAAFSPALTDSVTALGLLRLHAGFYIPECMLVHHGDHLLACDSVRRAQDGQLQDLVLGVNLPTQFLASCIVPLLHSRSALDLGTGCGTLALQMASYVERVVGTDINERALEFAALNAALNNRPNLEVRQGDRFEPVRDEQFDLIVANPPFFLTRSSKILFTDNPFSLDSFVESLARQAPERLTEGGYFQMLCEWVQVKGQPWPDRLRDWFRDSRCDILILKDYEIEPADYISLRAAESSSLHEPTPEEGLLDQLKYFSNTSMTKAWRKFMAVSSRSGAQPSGLMVPRKIKTGL